MYRIINEETIQKRIEELEIISKHNEKVGEYDSEGVLIDELKSILSISIPLIPEIEKAMKHAGNFPDYNDNEPLMEMLKRSDKYNQDYISQLKLDI
jgi:hypothetical protein